MMKTQIATTGIYVDNQEEFLRFWTEKMGFEIRAKHPMGTQTNWSEVVPKGAQSCLVPYLKSMMPSWRELKPSVVFLCDHVEKTFNALKSKGVNFVEGLKKMV
jgi:catechol 2,3-dioxygenase-like lactoylglutathione lyase family enzyme